MRIEIDFRNNQELLNSIGIQAQAEFRSIRGQIMAILMKHCKSRKPEQAYLIRVIIILLISLFVGTAHAEYLSFEWDANIEW